MALNLQRPRAKDDDKPFAFAFIRPGVSHVMRPGEAFAMPAVVSLDMQVEGLRGMLAFFREGAFCSASGPFSSRIRPRNLLLVSGIAQALPAAPVIGDGFRPLL